MTNSEVYVSPVLRVASRPKAATRSAPTWLVLSAFAAVYLIWGSTYLGIHVAIGSIPPFLMAGARFLIAGLILYPVMRLRGAPRPNTRHWLSAGVVGALLLLAGNGGVTWGQQTVSSGVTALMVAAVPLWMNLLEWLRPAGRRPSAAVLTGIGLGFAGVALIALGKDEQGRAVIDPAGAIALLIAPFCWAFGSLYSRQAEQNSSALLNVAMQMICGGALMLLLGGALGEAHTFQLSNVTASSARAFVYLTLIGSLVAFTAYVWLLQVSTPARVSSYAYVNPFVAVVLGKLILDEPFPHSVLMAGALIIVAVVLITSEKGRT